MDYLNKLFFKDARKMTELPDNSVQLVVTSPPYFNIKDYLSSFTTLLTLFKHTIRIFKKNIWLFNKPFNHHISRNFPS